MWCWLWLVTDNNNIIMILLQTRQHVPILTWTLSMSRRNDDAAGLRQSKRKYLEERNYVVACLVWLRSIRIDCQARHINQQSKNKSNHRFSHARPCLPLINAMTRWFAKVCYRKIGGITSFRLLPGAGCDDAVAEVDDNSDDALEMVMEPFVAGEERKYPRGVC